jgi:putative FmdB family regulatory protein
VHVLGAFLKLGIELMPLYEYRCDACEHEFEALQKISDEPLKHCPDCEQPQLRKLVSAAGFRLKGDGWYETDFKKGKKRNIAESDASLSAKKTETSS